MDGCTVETGVLFWKKRCGGDSIGRCKQCQRVVCARHCGRYPDASLLCETCLEASIDGIIPGISLFGAKKK